eukprot:761254-Hanusia_phi.AAC.5
MNQLTERAARKASTVVGRCWFLRKHQLHLRCGTCEGEDDCRVWLFERMRHIQVWILDSRVRLNQVNLVPCAAATAASSFILSLPPVSLPPPSSLRLLSLLPPISPLTPSSLLHTSRFEPPLVCLAVRQGSDRKAQAHRAHIDQLTARRISSCGHARGLLPLRADGKGSAEEGGRARGRAGQAGGQEDRVLEQAAVGMGGAAAGEGGGGLDEHEVTL